MDYSRGPATFGSRSIWSTTKAIKSLTRHDQVLSTPRELMGTSYRLLRTYQRRWHCLFRFYWTTV